MKHLLLSITLACCLTGCINEEPFCAVRKIPYTVVREYPHDAEAFTQGLVYYNGSVYESTGLYGKSSLRKVELRTGAVQQLLEHSQEIFAEGITILHDTIYQLTWKNNTIYQYRLDDFSLLASFPFPHEGWGITHNGEYLIISDGTAWLYFLDPDTMKEHHRLPVQYNQAPVSRLNELEYIDGMIYANIWKTERIVVIDPSSGAVSGQLDLAPLLKRVQSMEQVDVLNGIMYDPVSGRMFVTGKLWPLLFEIAI